MKKEINFILYSIYKNIQSAGELRASFVLNLFGMALNNSAFLLVWIIFGTYVSGMGGWRPYDVIGMLGLSAFGYGLCFSFFYGITELPDIVSRGDFDKYMLSPKNILLRVSSSKFSTPAMGDIFFGVICIVTWLYMISASPLQILLALLFGITSGLIFYFFCVFANSAAFYFEDSRSVVQGLFEFLITPSLFHGGAFQGLLRNFFVFVVPALLVGAYPLEIIRDLDPKKMLIVLVMTILWGFLSILLFNRSIKKYESSNFINFG